MFSDISRYFTHNFYYFSPEIANFGPNQLGITDNGWLFWGFTSLQQFFSHIATWNQEITNLWNRSGETGNQTPDLLLRKPRA